MPAAIAEVARNERLVIPDPARSVSGFFADMMIRNLNGCVGIMPAACLGDQAAPSGTAPKPAKRGACCVRIDEQDNEIPEKADEQSIYKRRAFR
jgi:hypothetical protein